jgi:hypothetical protein
MRVCILVSVLLLASLAAAQTASQSDWSGGPGVWGPVATWGSSFWKESGCSWLADPGSVTIGTGLNHPVDEAFNGARSIHSNDIDGDGDMDVLGAGDNADAINWWENADGLGTAWIEHPIDEAVIEARSVYSDDIDGDGDIDVLGGATWGFGIAWWENVDGFGTTWIEHNVDPDFDGAWGLYSADIDGDGDIDVLGAAWWDNDIAWWENIDGLGTTWIKHTIEGEFRHAASVYADDINGDGDMDVLGAAWDDDEIAWWENVDGLGTTWVKHTVTPNFAGAISVHSNDIDGDGDTDVIGAAEILHAVYWWENVNGTGDTWVTHSIDTALDGASSVHSNDLDGDGDIDVLGCAYFADRIAWWENSDGLGSTWIKHTLDPELDYADCVYSADVNGDENIDILATFRDADLVAWWDLHAYPGDARLESSILSTGCDPDWGTLLWSSQTPPGTAVSFQLRASDDYMQMGDWSDTIVSPCALHGILEDNANYIQYRAFLTTADPDTTPTLFDLTVTWDPLGTGDSEPSGTCLLPVTPNPSGPCPSIGFNLAEEGITEISVYDLSGRLVYEVGPSEYPSGYYSIQLQPLGSGIYFITMQAGEFTAIRRFAVVE